MEVIEHCKVWFLFFLIPIRKIDSRKDQKKLAKTFFIINSFCMTLVENENNSTLLFFSFSTIKKKKTKKKRTPKMFLFFSSIFIAFQGKSLLDGNFPFYNILVCYFHIFHNNAIEQLKSSDFFYSWIFFGIRLVMRKSRPNIIKFDYPFST